MNELERFKMQSAKEAVSHIKSGMVVGLGTGSTVKYALEFLGKMIRDGELKDIVGIPSSRETEKISIEQGIPLGDLKEYSEIDVTVDGADEVDNDLNLIKGGGGALLREKIIAQASKRNIIIVDETKITERLGTRFYLPVEVIPFGYGTEERFLKSIGAHVKLRLKEDSTPFETDQGNYILECNLGPIEDIEGLSNILDARAGIMAHGLFIGLATDVIVSGAGGIRHIKRS